MKMSFFSNWFKEDFVTYPGFLRDKDNYRLREAILYQYPSGLFAVEYLGDFFEVIPTTNPAEYKIVGDNVRYDLVSFVRTTVDEKK